LLRMHSMPCHAFHHWLSFPTPPSCFKRRCKSSTCTASPQTSTNLLHLHHTISHDITRYHMYDLSMTCLWPFYDAFICFICIYDPSIVWPSCSTAFLSRKMSKKTPWLMRKLHDHRTLVIVLFLLMNKYNDHVVTCWH
jgi:hypothetical protein